MTRIKIFFSRFLTSIVLALTVCGLFLAPSLASAQNNQSKVPDFSNQGCIGGRAFCDIGKSGDSRNQILNFIVIVANFVIYLLGGIAVLFIVYGGFLYVTDDGSGEKAKKGQKIVLQALIGLVIAIASFTLVQVTSGIVNNLNFGSSTTTGSTPPPGMINIL